MTASPRPSIGWFLLGVGLGLALARSPQRRRRAEEGEGEPEPAREPPFAHPIAEEQPAPEPAPLEEDASA